MSTPAKETLALVSAPAFHLAAPAAKKLMIRTLRDFVTFTKLEKTAALTATTTGLNLHRVKISAKGEFRTFIEVDLAKKMGWAETTAVKNASYYMRLSTAFFEGSGLKPAEIIAALDGNKVARKKLNAALKAFVADLSLNELLIQHGIKGVGLKTELDDAKSASRKALPISDEDKIAQARTQAWEEIYSAVERTRAGLTEPEKLQLLNDPKQLETLQGQLVEINKLAAQRIADLRKANAA